MNALHPSRERIRSLVQGLSPRGRHLLRHVTACSQCGEVFAQLSESTEGGDCHAVPGVLPWQGAQATGEAADGAGSPPAMDAPAVVFDADVEPLAALRELRECGVDLGSEAERRTGWSLVEHVLAESRKRRFQDPQEAEHVALLALRLMERVDESVYGRKLVMDLRARVWTYVGVARRLAARLRESEQAFEQAWSCLRQGTGDLLEEALLLESHGNLLTDQRRNEEGIRLFEKAVHRFLRIGDEEAAARAMMNLAIHHQQHGDMEPAIDTLESAVRHLRSSSDPVLTVMVHHNLISCLAEAGRHEQAQHMLARHEGLYDQAEPDIQLRRAWVQGRIDRGLGRIEEAEERFIAVREGYIAAGIGYDAALVSLDLATLYAEQGRFSEMRRLADEMLPVFRAQDIHREGLAALAIFQQAARVEGVTLKLARDLADYLDRARNQPCLRFEASR